MTTSGPPPPARDQVLVHFYRAVVMHMDVWRQRMDATTNWAAATSAVMITFALGNVESPHFVLVIAFGFDLVFLLMESRRYQIFDLWRRRFRLLNRHLIVPALLGEARAGETGAGLVAAGAVAGLEADATARVSARSRTTSATWCPASGWPPRWGTGYAATTATSSWW
jgi:uncharacterized membrane protein